MDSGMPHGIELTAANPPYSYMSMMQGGIYSGSFIPPLPEAQNDQYPVAASTFVVNQTGNFHYLCQVPGHAAKGMYGKMIVS
ncbi:plastocyanin [Alicyclobacillus sp. SO9]|nr:plastocyanin [Alicyclobacillus sp. SO9]